MKINVSQLFSVIILSTLTSLTALGANTDWPFPTDPATPAPGPSPAYDIASCKIITDGLVVVPGNSKDMKNTVQFGATAKLSVQVVNGKVIVTALLEGTNTFGNPVSNSFPAELSVSIGSDYRSYQYDAQDVSDELRSMSFELEILGSTDDTVGTKAILSTLAKSNAVNRAGKSYLRIDSARFMCDLIQN